MAAKSSKALDNTLQPDDLLSEAGRKVMRLQFERMLDNEAGTRQGQDIMALHDMRVATRRLRAAFEVFAEAFEPPALQPHLKGLRATGRALGQVRDLDVLIDKAGRYVLSLSETAPADEAAPADETATAATANPLAPLLAYWRIQRAAARAEMLAYLDSRPYVAFKLAFEQFLDTPGAGACLVDEAVPTPQRVCELAPLLIYRRMAHVRAYGPSLPGAPIEHLHALRIEFKKLRYTLEYFRPVLEPAAQEAIQTIKGLQDHLGDMNDASIAADLAQAFITHAKARPHPNLGGVYAYLDERQTETLRLQHTFEPVWQAQFDTPVFRQMVAEAIKVL